MTEPNAITVEIAKLELKPGDVLLVRYPIGCGAEYREELKHVIKRALPDDVRFLVCPDTVSFDVAGKTDGE